MGEKIFWCDGIRYVLAESWLKGCTGRTVFSKIFWCDEVKSRKASKVISLSTLVFKNCGLFVDFNMS